MSEWTLNRIMGQVCHDSTDGMGPRFEQLVELAIDRESRLVWDARFKNRKVDLYACEGELRQRNEILVGLQAALERRKAVLTDWESGLRPKGVASV